MNASRTDDDWDAIGSSVGFNALIALVFLSLYYFLQDRLPQIYTPKDSRTSFFTRYVLSEHSFKTIFSHSQSQKKSSLIQYSSYQVLDRRIGERDESSESNRVRRVHSDTLL